MRYIQNNVNIKAFLPACAPVFSRIGFFFLLLLVLCSGLSAMNLGSNIGFGNQQGKSASANRLRHGMMIFPTYTRFKGFDSVIGADLSYVHPAKKSKDNVHIFSLAYSKPGLNDPFNNMKMDFWRVEYENRDYVSAGFFTNFRTGIRKLVPNNPFKSWYETQGFDTLYQKWKPFLSFGVGWRVPGLVPGLGALPVLNLNYTLSDDYRFPADGPHGYQKVPLKGFQAGVSIKF